MYIYFARFLYVCVAPGPRRIWFCWQVNNWKFCVFSKYFECIINLRLQIVGKYDSS